MIYYYNILIKITQKFINCQTNGFKNDDHFNNGVSCLTGNSKSSLLLSRKNYKVNYNSDDDGSDRGDGDGSDRGDDGGSDDDDDNDDNNDNNNGGSDGDDDDDNNGGDGDGY